MKKIIQTYEVWLYLVSIVLINSVFIFSIHKEIIDYKFFNYGRFLVLAGSMVGIIFISRGIVGVIDTFKPFLKWKISPLWFVFALSWASFIALVTLSIKTLFFDYPVAQWIDPSGVKILFKIIVTVVIGAFLSEVVWVSYSIGRLSKTMPMYTAAVIVGVFWSLWWLPMAVANIGIIPGLKFLPLTINMVGVAIMSGFVYYWTRSALCVLTLQIMVNSSALIFAVMPVSGGEQTYFWFSVLYFTLSSLMFVLFGPKPMFSKSMTLKHNV